MTNLNVSNNADLTTTPDVNEDGFIWYKPTHPLIETDIRLDMPFRIYETSVSNACLNFDSLSSNLLTFLDTTSGDVLSKWIIANIYFGCYATGETFFIAGVIAEHLTRVHHHDQLIEMLEAAKKTWIICNKYDGNRISDSVRYRAINWNLLQEPNWEELDPIESFVCTFSRDEQLNTDEVSPA